MDKLTYGDKIEVDFSALPEVSQFALASRGLTHILGNEVASKVHAWAGAEGQANSDDKAVVKAWKDANPEKLAAKTSEVQADILDALNKGELGSRVSGPRLAPLDTIKRQIARKEVEDILRGNKLAVPKGEAKVKMGDAEFTMAQLIDRRIEKFSDRITAAATKELAARAKAMKAAAENAQAALADL